MITHILYQEQIKHLVSKGLWPSDDPDFVIDDRKILDANTSAQTAAADGIVYDDAYNMPRDDDDYGIGDDEKDYPEDPLASLDDPLLFVNTNRIARMTVQDSSSSDEED